MIFRSNAVNSGWHPKFLGYAKTFSEWHHDFLG